MLKIRPAEDLLKRRKNILFNVFVLLRVVNFNGAANWKLLLKRIQIINLHLINVNCIFQLLLGNVILLTIQMHQILHPGHLTWYLLQLLIQSRYLIISILQKLFILLILISSHKNTTLLYFLNFNQLTQPLQLLRILF